MESKGRPRTRTLYPIATMHWQSAIRRYGFNESNAINKRSISCCCERIQYRIDKKQQCIYASVAGNTPISIDYKHTPQITQLIRDGYVEKKTVFCFDDRLSVLSLVGKGHLNNSRQKKKKHAIICMDVSKATVLACLEIKTSDGKENLCDVEVWECDVSTDGCLLAMSVSLLMDDSFHNDSCENFVSLYDRRYNREIKRIWNWDNIVCGLAFDPRSHHSQFALVGMRQTIRDRASLSLYDVSKKTPEQQVTIGHEIDEDGETYFHLQYSKDGEFLILQMIDTLAYGREWMSRTSVYHADSLQLVCKCQPTLTMSCHVGRCVPRSYPILSTCNSHMALGSFRGKQGSIYDSGTRTLDVDIYKLPVTLNLQHLCRIAVLSAMVDVTTDVAQLPLPNAMKNYLQWRPLGAPSQSYTPLEPVKTIPSPVKTLTSPFSSRLDEYVQQSTSRIATYPDDTSRT